MNKTLAFVLAWFVLFVAAITLSRETSSHPLVVVESVGATSFTPIKELDDGWYLVEVKQKYTCQNPLPIGSKELTVIVPHLVRMRASEL